MLVNRLRMMPDDGGAASGGEGSSSGVSTAAPVGAGQAGAGESAGNANSVSPSFSDRIPKDYLEKPYVQKLLKAENPEAEFFKEFDNLQQMMGKPKVGVPAADAPQEEWDKFNAMLRPESPDKYELPDPDFGEEKKELSETVKNLRDEEFIKEMRQVAFEEGIRPQAFAKLAAKFEQATGRVLEAQAQGQVSASQAQETEFTELAKKTFGEDMDAALVFAQKAITEVFPGQKERMSAKDNQQLLDLAYMAKFYESKYNKEDSFDKNGTAGAVSAKDMKETYRKMLSEMWKLPENSVERRQKAEEAKAYLVKIAEKERDEKK